jgi:hypothetical protein
MPELAISNPEAGCACDGERDVCVSAYVGKRLWNIALTCSGGMWLSVDDGPCSPGLEPEHAGCLVGDQSYAHGEAAPDPFSCNQCSCDSGQITACTEINCPTACPEGTAQGSECAQCGATDACLLVRTACLPTCEGQDDCSATGGICSEGVCRNLCG